MQLSRNAKGAIAFLSVIAVAHVWSAVTSVYKPPWEPWPPIIPFMGDWVVPFLHHIYRPILIGFGALAVLWLWEEERRGYLLCFALMIVASAFGVSITVFNVIQGEWSGAFTAVLTLAYPAVMALWYSWLGLQAGAPGAAD